MEKICIDFEGFISLDKNDIKITSIDEKTGCMIPVDVTNLSVKEIIDGYKKGNYYISLDDNFKFALDGEENCTLDYDE